jgi:hypothetical protein
MPQAGYSWLPSEVPTPFPWDCIPLLQVTDPSKAAAGDIFAFAGVYDGHGEQQQQLVTAVEGTVWCGSRMCRAWCSCSSSREQCCNPTQLPLTHHQPTGRFYLPACLHAGGSAVAEWLQSNLMGVVSSKWSGKAPEADITEAYLQADSQLLVAKGFMGMGEFCSRRSVSRCEGMKGVWQCGRAAGRLTAAGDQGLHGHG